MKYKVKVLAEKYVDIISKWTGVECIALNEAALPDTLDPYFALILDVFYTDDIPPPAEREKFYAAGSGGGGEKTSFFETSGSKDRFFVGEIPLRFEYKSVKRIEQIVTAAYTNIDAYHPVRDSGTYTFYRLAEGEILFSRSGWIVNLRKRLGKLSGEFWNFMRGASQSKMEHYLNDMGAALLQYDDFFALMSGAGFIKEACLTLFCINKKFEPSHRQYYKQVLELKILPQSFSATLETFLRNDAESTIDRKYSTAQLIARGIVAL
jgi:hypothetical protein